MSNQVNPTEEAIGHELAEGVRTRNFSLVECTAEKTTIGVEIGDVDPDKILAVAAEDLGETPDRVNEQAIEILALAEDEEEDLFEEDADGRPQ